MRWSGDGMERVEAPAWWWVVERRAAEPKAEPGRARVVRRRGGVTPSAASVKHTLPAKNG